MSYGVVEDDEPFDQCPSLPHLKHSPDVPPSPPEPEPLATCFVHATTHRCHNHPHRSQTRRLTTRPMTDLSTPEAFPWSSTIHHTSLDPRTTPESSTGASTSFVPRWLIIPLKKRAARILVIWTSPELSALVCSFLQDGLLHSGKITDTAS